MNYVKNDFFVAARHVLGVSNEIADALSHFQDAQCQALASKAETLPCTISPLLQPSKGRSSNLCNLGPDMENQQYVWVRGNTFHQVLLYEWDYVQWKG